MATPSTRPSADTLEKTRSAEEIARARAEVDTLEAALRHNQNIHEKIADVARDDAKRSAERFKTQADALGRFQSGIASKRAGAMIPALYKMWESGMIEAPVRGKPNTYVLNQVNYAVNQNPALEAEGNERARRQFAWETFLENMPSVAGADWLATVTDMEQKFGSIDDVLAAGITNPTAAKTLHDLREKLEAERRIAAAQGAFYNQAMDVGPQIDALVKDGKTLDEIAADDLLMQKWAKQLNFGQPGMTDYMRRLDANLKGAEEDYRNNPEIRDSSLRAAAKRLEESLIDVASLTKGETGPPENYMAAWLSLPDAKWWAEQNGFRVGTVVPVNSEEERKALLAKHPAAMMTKYGLYLPGVDDEKAARFAYGQMNRDPRKNILRAMGIGRGGATGDRTREVVEVTLKPRQEGVREVGEAPDGTIVMKAANGAYYTTTDGESFQLAYEAPKGTVFKPAPADTKIDLPSETVKGVAERPLYGQRTGAVALRTADGKLVTLEKDDIIESRSLLGGDERTPLAQRVAAGRAKKLLDATEVAPGGAIAEQAVAVTEEPVDAPAKTPLAKAPRPDESVARPRPDLPVELGGSVGDDLPDDPASTAKRMLAKSARDALKSPADVARETKMTAPAAKPAPALPKMTDPTKAAEAPAPDMATPARVADKARTINALPEERAARPPLRKPIAKEDRPDESVGREMRGNLGGFLSPPPKADAAEMVFEDEVIPRPQSVTTSTPTLSEAEKAKRKLALQATGAL